MPRFVMPCSILAAVFVPLAGRAAALRLTADAPVALRDGPRSCHTEQGDQGAQCRDEPPSSSRTEHPQSGLG